MTKQDLISAVSADTGLSKSVVAKVTDSLLETMRGAFRMHDTIYLRGFGTFKIVCRPPRQARDICAGKTIQVPARHKLKFIPAPKVKEDVAEGDE
ncbi:MAG: HU family DNA-binding protein [Muribaculaceae bacterium]|nr:HU family DNA-binding protein [Muribaculaceae bacterium]MDE7081796.1 HU family DNA-binding protein [Muribaculaceae bacterium]